MVDFTNQTKPAPTNKAQASSMTATPTDAAILGKPGMPNQSKTSIDKNSDSAANNKIKKSLINNGV